MHITLEEAISLLDNWKLMGTLLRVRCSRPDGLRELKATVKSIKDGVAELSAISEEMKIDLHGAEFNGDRRESARSDYGAYPPRRSLFENQFFSEPRKLFQMSASFHELAGRPGMGFPEHLCPDGKW